jgi:hypothetical protein
MKNVCGKKNPSGFLSHFVNVIFEKSVRLRDRGQVLAA